MILTSTGSRVSVGQYSEVTPELRDPARSNTCIVGLL